MADPNITKTPSLKGFLGPVEQLSFQEGVERPTQRLN